MFGDDFMLALDIWREARGEGAAGMQAVGCATRNRVLGKLYGLSSYYEHITRKWQYSSITAPKDPELPMYPTVNDPQWLEIQAMVPKIIDGSLPDNTNGAQFYYAVSISLPAWAHSMTMTTQIGKQRFYRQ